ncbi:hypothetical protein CBR_g21751 [Chara braunii]|uniref:FHA domain-containing protein n=1 Tax=Chara braunii TaxID=69332 RepID=A0A388L1C9_CHABU|nr:hypothetical protein CBR_g21751 [Chara braunii]|eukprot:GBG76091.1 hypothetical protein CBR_g21751 [Chara braunii]
MPPKKVAKRNRPFPAEKLAQATNEEDEINEDPGAPEGSGYRGEVEDPPRRSSSPPFLNPEGVRLDEEGDDDREEGGNGGEMESPPRVASAMEASRRARTTGADELKLEVLSGPAKGMAPVLISSESAVIGRIKKGTAVHIKDPTTAPVLISSESAVIGRIKKGTAVHIKDPTISERHAVVSWDETKGEWNISDLGSSNGTFLNGARVRKGTLHPLRDCDVLHLGLETDMFVLVTPKFALDDISMYDLAAFQGELAIKRAEAKVDLEIAFMQKKIKALKRHLIESAHTSES